MAFCSKKKSKLWVWLVVDRSRMAIIDFVVGTRGEKTGKCLWEKVKHISCFRHMSDYWEAYQKFLPKKKHTASKKETFSVEGMNSLIRHFLARFRRRTRCYSKSASMVVNTLLLFQHREMARKVFLS